MANGARENQGRRNTASIMLDIAQAAFTASVYRTARSGNCRGQIWACKRSPKTFTGPRWVL
jgi:hypothetical protein